MVVQKSDATPMIANVAILICMIFVNQKLIKLASLSLAPLLLATSGAYKSEENDPSRPWSPSRDTSLVVSGGVDCGRRR